MSDGLSRFNGLRGSDGSPTEPLACGSVDTLFIGTPSMTYRGSFLALTELPPRIRICAPAPGSPLFWVISTPAARPWIIWSTLVMTPTFAASALTVETDPVMASRRCVPYPVTTTGSRIAAAGARQTCDQRGNEVTDESHTSALCGVGSGTSDRGALPYRHVHNPPPGETLRSRRAAGLDMAAITEVVKRRPDGSGAL